MTLSERQALRKARSFISEALYEIVEERVENEALFSNGFYVDLRRLDELLSDVNLTAEEHNVAENTLHIQLPNTRVFHVYPGNYTPLERGLKVSIITGSLLSFLHIGYLWRNYKTIQFASKWLFDSPHRFALYSTILSVSAGVGFGLLLGIAVAKLIGHLQGIDIPIGEILSRRMFHHFRDDGESVYAVVHIKETEEVNSLLE